MRIYYNPLDPASKNITGGIKEGELLELNLFTLKDGNNLKLSNFAFPFVTPTEDDCIRPNVDAFLCLGKDGEEKQLFTMTVTPYGYKITLKIEEKGLYYYRFRTPYGDITENENGIGSLFAQGADFILTVSERKFQTPEWFKGGIMYQIFPDRFAKVGETKRINGRTVRTDWGGTPSYRSNENGKVLNNDFFGGNLQGIKNKLGYLKSLHVSTIYLNPIFEAASNHRYDTSDYENIDPMLGTKDDFKELTDKAKENGISIILDGVFNHTGDNSVYFNKYGQYPSVGAYQSKKSPYYDWYNFYEYPSSYASWWGIDILPEVNERSKSYQDFLFGENGVLKQWLSYGIGGYRLDVADELPDEFLKLLRKSVKEKNPNAVILGEVWEDASDKISYGERKTYLLGEELDSVMNYPAKNAIISFIIKRDASELIRCVTHILDHYPKETVDCLMNILGTHDTYRILSVFSEKRPRNKEEMADKHFQMSAEEKKEAVRKLKSAVILQYTLPGVPCIYYGDENGMEGFGDPFCRKCFDWEHFDEDLIGFYKKVGQLRETYKDIYRDGSFYAVMVDGGCIVYRREKDGKKIYTFVNESPNAYRLSENCQELLSGQTIDSVTPFSCGIFLEP